MANTYVKLEHADKKVDALLTSGVDVLAGVTPQSKERLNALGVRTVGDLANNEYFVAADTIAKLSTQGNTLPLSTVAPGLVDAEVSTQSAPEILKAPFTALKGIGDVYAGMLSQIVAADAVGDLAIWPPYIAAREIRQQSPRLQHEMRQYSVEDNENGPAELLPVGRLYETQKQYYHKIFVDDEIDSLDGRGRDLQFLNGAVDVLEGLEKNYFDKPFLGAHLTYEQVWIPHALSLGALTHSLALAPGESTRIAIIDWHRQVQGTLSEDVTQSEQLQNEMRQSSAIAEIAEGVVTEEQSGISGTTTDTTSHSSGSSGGMLSSIVGGSSSGNAYNTAKTVSVSSSTGQRNVAMESMQDLNRSTQQNAAAVRSKYAATVKEVQHSETEELRTRIVTNYNHSHALSIHYYEVVQIYKTLLSLHKCERVIFIPMKLLDLGNSRVLKKFRSVLKAGARNEAEYRYLARATGEVLVQNEALQSYVKRQSFYFDEDAILTELVVSSPSSDPWDVKKITIHLKHREAPLEHAELVSDGRGAYRLELDAQLTLKEIDKIEIIYDVREDERDRLWAQTRLTLLSESGRQTKWLHHHLPNPKVIASSTILSVEPDFYASDYADTLADDQDYFSALIWNGLSESQLARILSSYKFDGRPLIGSIDFPSVGLYGNCLVFKYRDESDSKWQSWLRKKVYAEQAHPLLTDEVSVPTSGVFAEAVQGRYNASEKIDLTRFWNWQDSPIPYGAPEISALQAGNHVVNDSMSTASLEPSVVNMQTPQAFPDYQGMGALQGALTATNLFRDMSGLAASITANSAGLQNTSSAAIRQSELAGENYQAAIDAVGKVVAAIATGGASVGAEVCAAVAGGKSSTQFGGEYNLASGLDKVATSAAGGAATGGGAGGAMSSGGSVGGAGGGGTPVQRSNTQKVLDSAIDPAGHALAAINESGLLPDTSADIVSGGVGAAGEDTIDTTTAGAIGEGLRSSVSFVEATSDSSFKVVLFDFPVDSAEIGSTHDKVLKKLAMQLYKVLPDRDPADLVTSFDGYASTEGGDGYAEENQQLSTDRAQKVAWQLSLHLANAGYAVDYEKQLALKAKATGHGTARPDHAISEVISNPAYANNPHYHALCRSVQITLNRIIDGEIEFSELDDEYDGQYVADPERLEVSEGFEPDQKMIQWLKAWLVQDLRNGHSNPGSAVTRGHCAVSKCFEIPLVGNPVPKDLTGGDAMNDAYPDTSTVDEHWQIWIDSDQVSETPILQSFNENAFERDFKHLQPMIFAVMIVAETQDDFIARMTSLIYGNVHNDTGGYGRGMKMLSDRLNYEGDGDTSNPVQERLLKWVIERHYDTSSVLSCIYTQDSVEKIEDRLSMWP